MKNLFLLLVAALLGFGCSKQKEPEGETIGKKIVGRMKAPIEKTREVTEKIGDIRAAEDELMK